MNINNPVECFRFFQDKTQQNQMGDWLFQLDPDGHILQLIFSPALTEADLPTLLNPRNQYSKDQWLFVRISEDHFLFDEADWLWISACKYRAHQSGQIFADFIKISKQGFTSYLKFDSLIDHE